MKEKITTFDQKKKKEVFCGFVEDNVFYREVKPEHFVLKYKGYGIQMGVFDSLWERGIEAIVITSKKFTHKASLKIWQKWGHVDDLGHGLQIFLPIIRMEKNDFYKNQKKML